MQAEERRAVVLSIISLIKRLYVLMYALMCCFRDGWLQRFAHLADMDSRQMFIHLAYFYGTCVHSSCHLAHG